MAKYIFSHETMDYVIPYEASNPLNAWNGIEIRKRHAIYPDAFFTSGQVSCYLLDGTLVATMTANAWHNAVLRDTYGDDWEQIMSRAEVLIR